MKLLKFMSLEVEKEIKGSKLNNLEVYKKKSPWPVNQFKTENLKLLLKISLREQGALLNGQDD